jgi:putative ABC transport system permease protein
LGSLGADVLTISPGIQRAFGAGFGGGSEGSSASVSTIAKNLTENDIVVIKGVSNVKYAMGQVSGRADVSYLSKTIKNMNINGVDISLWKDITTETLSSGRFLATGDMYAVVIGKSLADSSFSEPVTLNTKLIIGGQSFNVVGILSEGRSIYIPIVVARTLLDGVGLNEFGSISVKISDVSLSNQTVADITNKLMLSRGILDAKKKDFSVSNPASMQATIEQTLSTITLFLGAIAAISLLVGAIGIANTMFTAVLEKTKEIGIMKAIGTQNKDILTIFLLNSGLIGFTGGLGGVILGTAASAALSSFAGVSTPIAGAGRGGFGVGLGGLLSSSTISIPLIVGALIFAMLIGMIAGAIPAYRASKLNPVDALRYE